MPPILDPVIFQAIGYQHYLSFSCLDKSGETFSEIYLEDIFKSLKKYPSPLPCCVTLHFCLHFESTRELIAGEYYDIKRKKKDCKVEVTSKVRKRKQRKGLAGIRNVKRRLALVL